MRWSALAIAMSAAVGAALGAVLALWEPTWGAAAALPLLCCALAAGVVRDPDGPEIHHFLKTAMALSAAFSITNAAVTTIELDRIVARASERFDTSVVRDAIRMRAQLWPKWIAMGAGVPIGAAALAWRAHVRRKAARRGRGTGPAT